MSKMWFKIRNIIGCPWLIIIKVKGLILGDPLYYPLYFSVW